MIFHMCMGEKYIAHMMQINKQLKNTKINIFYEINSIILTSKFVQC